jgi:acyl-CoA synthetase (AMP-forming)/AMP-acid ligase II
MLAEQAVQRPEMPAVTFEDTTVTYGGLWRDAEAFAAGLADIGIGRGDRVAIWLDKRIETVVSVFGTSAADGVFVPINPLLRARQVAYILGDCGVRVVVTSAERYALLRDELAALPSVQHVVILGLARDAEPATGAALHHWESIAGTDPAGAPPATAIDIDMAAILYTSGSTGRPKGVMLKAGSRYHCGTGYADLYGFTSEDTYFLPLTLGHSLGSSAGLGIPMATGGALALAERFRPSKFWAQVEASGGTISVLFQAHLGLLLETDDGSVDKGSSSLRFVVTHTYLPRFVERYGVELGTIWGMSETLICVGSDPGYRGELGPGYVGRPFGDGEVGVFDESFARLGPYEYGELCMRHSQVMLGYLKDREATEATLVDGWVRSGDRGYVDHSGRAYFAGRFKAMIKRSGENVSAEEVEAALGDHPAVAECCVVAVPDPIRAEEVGAVVVPRAGSEVDPVALREACGERLIRWKLPRFIVVSEESLPRLGNGKIDRVGVAAMIDPDRAWDADAQDRAATRS